MKNAQRWDFFGRQYSQVQIPDDCLTYSNNMDAEVTCPNCNRKFKFGDMYTSRRWHTKYGCGFMVCGECYEEEWVLERQAKYYETLREQ